VGRRSVLRHSIWTEGGSLLARSADLARFTRMNAAGFRWDSCDRYVRSQGSRCLLFQGAETGEEV
jgi:hypothetical protein